MKKNKTRAAELVAHRKQVGLVKITKWICKDDLENVSQLIEPFVEKARGQSSRKKGRPRTWDFDFSIEQPIGYRLPKSVPAHYRNKLKENGWLYDRENDIWNPNGFFEAPEELIDLFEEVFEN